MVTDATFAAFVRSIRYKPGWRFAVKPHPYGASLAILAQVPDVNNPTRMTEVANARDVGDFYLQTPEAWPHLIHSLIADLELHEVDEWLHLGKARLREPHPK